MKAKKVLALALAAVCVLGMLAGCGKQGTGTVSTDGSTSMEKVIGSLKETFEAENKGITVTYNPTGSGTGITAAAEGRCDIGLSSRDLKEDEKAKGLEGTVIAYDGIAVIVNPENAVEDLTIEEIAKLYTGEIKNWKEVGGMDAEIVLIGREAGSGTRDGFESITGTKDQCKLKQELTSTGDVITTVAGNPAAIGYLRMISSALKMVTDMERIGDNSGDIAEIVTMANISPFDNTEHIQDMARATIKMVTDSIDAFVKRDMCLANAVIAYDDVVDGFFDEIKTDLIEKFGDPESNGEKVLDLLMIAKYFERMGDHAAEISKWVLFSMTGKKES